MVSRLSIIVLPHCFLRGFAAEMRISPLGTLPVPVPPQDEDFDLALGAGLSHPVQDFELLFEPPRGGLCLDRNRF